MRQRDSVRLLFDHLKHLMARTANATVQAMRALVGGQVPPLAIETELRLPNPVGIAPNDAPHRQHAFPHTV